MGWFSEKEAKKDYVKELRSLIHKDNKSWGLNILIAHVGFGNECCQIVAQIKNTITDSIKYLSQTFTYPDDCYLEMINSLCKGVLADIKLAQERSDISAAIEKVGCSWSRAETVEEKVESAEREGLGLDE